MDWLKKILSRWIINYLTKPSFSRAKSTTNSPELLRKTVRPGDVLLVEGTQRFSTAIKYFTQSNWSHVGIYMGEYAEGYGKTVDGKKLDLLEADLKEGVRLIPLEEYGFHHTRICRPINLSSVDMQTIADFCLQQLGHTYDTKNIIDLARYLLPLPPVPTRYKRKVLELGSGDPTKVICSSLIADAFQKIDYPILPLEVKKNGSEKYYKKIPPNFFVPSDFDRSPYFDIMKPTIECGFTYKSINWE